MLRIATDRIMAAHHRSARPSCATRSRRASSVDRRQAGLPEVGDAGVALRPGRRRMSRVAVMGSGSWGTAFSMVLSDAGNEVVLWGKDAEVAEAINTRHENPVSTTPGSSCPRALRATLDVAEALAGAEISRAGAAVAGVTREPGRLARRASRADCPARQPGEGHRARVAAADERGHRRGGRGARRTRSPSCPDPTWRARSPSASRRPRWRPARRRPTPDGCSSASLTPYFRPYTNTDVIGVEIGGAVKNVIALANGIAVGMGLGENAQASLITRGLAEITRLGVALGADPMTFAGLAGVGDLVATCQSPLSRNRTFGEYLGKGLSVEETIAVSRQTWRGQVLPPDPRPRPGGRRGHAHHRAGRRGRLERCRRPRRSSSA